jgi:hypothetical protein
LLNYFIEIAHTKIDHPVLLGIIEIFAVLRKGSKGGRANLLQPWLLSVIGGRQIDAEMLLIPVSYRSRILCAEEQGTNSIYSLPAKFWLTKVGQPMRQMISDCCDCFIAGIVEVDSCWTARELRCSTNLRSTRLKTSPAGLLNSPTAPKAILNRKLLEVRLFFDHIDYLEFNSALGGHLSVVASTSLC